MSLVKISGITDKIFSLMLMFIGLLCILVSGYIGYRDDTSWIQDEELFRVWIVGLIIALFGMQSWDRIKGKCKCP